MSETIAILALILQIFFIICIAYLIALIVGAIVLFIIIKLTDFERKCFH